MKRFLFSILCLAALVVRGAAPGNLRTYTDLNTILTSNPTLLGPHVVIESYWPGLSKGGMELVWTPADATDTNTFSHFKSQSTDWTSPNGRWIAVQNGNNYDVTTGGARGDWPTTADDATTINLMVAVLAQNGIPANIVFPVGVYGDPGGLLVGKHNGVSYSTVNGIHFIGDVKTASGEPGQVQIVVTDGLAAGILMQNCADCSVENINFVGMNSFFGEAKVDENNFAGTFLDIENFKSSVNTVSTNRYAPHVGIAIDPFSSTTPSQYPGLAANYVGTNGASSSIKILNCTFTDLVAPWVVTPATDGGGVHHFLAENCKTIQSTYGAGFGTSLVDFRIKNHQWRDVFTIFSTDDFGNQTGTIPHAEGHAKFVTYIFQDALTNINANINIEYQNIQAKGVGGAGPEADGTLMIVGYGYDDSGTHFLSDGGGYKAVGGGDDINWTNIVGVITSVDADLFQFDAVTDPQYPVLLVTGTDSLVGTFGLSPGADGVEAQVNGPTGVSIGWATTGLVEFFSTNIIGNIPLNLGTLGKPFYSLSLMTGKYTDDGSQLLRNGSPVGGAVSDNWVASGTTNSLLYGTGFVDSLVVTNGINFGAGSTNTLFREVASLIYSNALPHFTIKNPSGSVDFLVSATGSSQMATTGDLTIANGSASLVFTGTTLHPLTPVNLGSASLNFGDLRLNGVAYIPRVTWNGSTNSVFDTRGNGSPEGVVTASPGSTYRNFDGGTGTTFYRKEIGVSNTGWVASTAGGSGDALVANPLSQFAATTSAQLKGVLSDENGGASGKVIFAEGTLTLASGKTFTANNTLTFAGTDGTTMTFPTTTATIARTDAGNTFTGNQVVNGNITFTDATYDIGASLATRPRNYYGSGNIYLGNNTTFSGVATPLVIDMGGTYSTGSASTATNAKLKFYNDGTTVYGMGITANSFNFFTGSAASYAFYAAGGSPVVNFTSAGNVSAVGTLNITGASTLTGGLVGGVQALSGAGAVNVTTVTTALTSTGVLDALTLANGANGQIKTIIHDVDGGSALLTPTTKTGFSTVTFTAVGETVTLQYLTTRGWFVIGSYGAVIAP